MRTKSLKLSKKNEQGRSVSEISRQLGIDKSTFYYWRKKYGGMEKQELKRLKELEEENRKLKQMLDISVRFVPVISEWIFHSILHH
ncbi:transposase [Myroides fluvii]|uniref:transposase n=1 Tax=Myroides fluvii TaxID=2572594 RepID=UPI00131CFFD3